LTGLIGGGAVAILYLRRRGGSLKGVLDAAGPGLAVFMGLRALADLFSGHSLGAISSVPWGISVWGESRHPVQLYELAFWALATVLIWRSGVTLPTSGALFLLWVACFGAAEVLIEPFRAQSALVLGSVRVSQVVGLLLIMGSLWLMRVWWRYSVTVPDQDSEGTTS
jgi:prolipoprotein diacylglyceryltransferase